MFDGCIVESARITYNVSATCRIHDHYQSELQLFVTQLAYYYVVLGAQCPKKHDSTICFAGYTIEFNSEHCRKNCNVPGHPNQNEALPEILKSARQESKYDCLEILEKYNIASVSLRASAAFARKKRYCLFTTTLDDIGRALRLGFGTVRTETKKSPEIPFEFRDFQDAFWFKEAERLPSHRLYDLHIPLQEGNNSRLACCMLCPGTSQQLWGNTSTKIFRNASFAQTRHPLPSLSCLFRRRMEASAFG